MKDDIIEIIKTKFKNIGEIYCVFKRDNKYAVSFNDSSETICVFDESFERIEFYKFYDEKGGEISSSWKIIYQRK